MAMVIADIIDELASEKFMRFNIVIYGNHSKFPLFCNEIIKRSNPPVEVQVFSGEDEMRYDMNIPRVILASSRVKFSKEMYQQFEVYSPNVNAITIIFYYYVENIDTTWYQLNPKIPGMNRILFLVYSSSKRTKEVLKLYSYLKYQENSCEGHTFDSINYFSFINMRWKTKIFYKSYASFNNCSLIALVTDGKSFHVVNSKEIFDFGGIYKEILLLFGKKHHAVWRQLFVDESKIKRARLLVELTIAFDFEYRNKDFYLHLTPSVYQHELAFMTLRQAELTPQEKLILPFDSATWCMVIASICFGYIVIFIIYRLPLSMQQIVLGIDNRNPSLHLTQIFLELV